MVFSSLIFIFVFLVLLLANLFVGYMVGAREISGNFPDRFKPVPFDQISDMLFNKHKDS